MRAYAARLRDASSTVEVASTIATESARMLGLRGLAFEIHATSGQPTVGIADWCTPESTLEYMTRVYKHDPVLAHVRRTGELTTMADLLPADVIARMCREFGIAEARNDSASTAMQVAAPLHGIGDILGLVRFWPECVAGETARRDMDRISAMAALRLAQLGVVSPVYSPALALLTPRQGEVARLVARGSTNHEVADALQISVNTVKKNLKLIFAILGVTNRTELAALLARSVPHVENNPALPAGYHAVWVDVHDRR